MSQTTSAVAVVTGAASGIGRAFVRRLLSQGFTCVAADVDERRLADARLGAIEVRCDVTQPAEVQALAERAFGLGLPVALVVHCAGVLATGMSWSTPLPQWRRIIDVNLFGTVHVLQAFMPRLLAQGHGRMVNIASLAALTSGAGVGPYSVSKHGVLALSECAAHELAVQQSAVQVHVVCPGAVRTAIADGLGSDPAMSVFDVVLKTKMDAGMTPEAVVDHTLVAIGRGEFCIFPHPKVRDSARRRLEKLLQGAL